MEQKQFPVFDRSVDTSVVPQHLLTCKNYTTHDLLHWLQILLKTNIILISQYLKVTRHARKYLGSSVMSVSCLPALAGIRDSRETLLELEFRSTVTDN